jgi:hypothetical protein
MNRLEITYRWSIFNALNVINPGTTHVCSSKSRQDKAIAFRRAIEANCNYIQSEILEDYSVMKKFQIDEQERRLSLSTYSVDYMRSSSIANLLLIMKHSISMDYITNDLAQVMSSSLMEKTFGAVMRYIDQKHEKSKEEYSLNTKRDICQDYATWLYMQRAYVLGFAHKTGNPDCVGLRFYSIQEEEEKKEVHKSMMD